MAATIRHFALAALAFAAVLATPASAEWTEWTPAEELGWTSGPEDAPVTVIEYFSPTCSHCREFAEDVLPTIRTDYIETGKVRFIMREWIRNDVDKIILSQARCLDNENGKAFLHDVFARQDDVFAAAGAGTIAATLIDIGKDYGIADRAAFDACHTDMNTRFDMLSVEETADHYGVHASPTFIVDGTSYDATVSMMTPEGFSAFLDAELAKTATPPTN